MKEWNKIKVCAKVNTNFKINMSSKNISIGPGNVWTNNGSDVSVTVKNAAGLEPAFRDLLEK